MTTRRSFFASVAAVLVAGPSALASLWRRPKKKVIGGIDTATFNTGPTQAWAICKYTRDGFTIVHHGTGNSFPNNWELNHDD